MCGQANALGDGEEQRSGFILILCTEGSVHEQEEVVCTRYVAYAADVAFDGVASLLLPESKLLVPSFA